MAQVVFALEMDVQGPVQIDGKVAILLVCCQANIIHFYNGGIGPHPKPRNNGGRLVSF
jgi:hypothetical protein